VVLTVLPGYGLVISLGPRGAPLLAGLFAGAVLIGTLVLVAPASALPAGLHTALGPTVTVAAQATAVAAGACWACFDGFVAHRFGTLHANPADLIALAVVAGAALGACAVRTVIARGCPGFRMPRTLPGTGRVAGQV